MASKADLVPPTEWGRGSQRQPEGASSFFVTGETDTSQYVPAGIAELFNQKRQLRVKWQAYPQEDSGLSGVVVGKRQRRVLAVAISVCNTAVSKCIWHEVRFG